MVQWGGDPERSTAELESQEAPLGSMEGVCLMAGAVWTLGDVACGQGLGVPSPARSCGPSSPVLLRETLHTCPWSR